MDHIPGNEGQRAYEFAIGNGINGLADLGSAFRSGIKIRLYSSMIQGIEGRAAGYDHRLVLMFS